MFTLLRSCLAAWLLFQAAPLVSASLALPLPDVRVPHGSANGPVLWSDPATWGGAPPEYGDSVHVPAGVELVLDLTPRPLAELRVMGHLSVGDAPVRLGVDHVVVMGVFEVGTAADPCTQPVGIVLSDRFLGQGHPNARLLEVMPGGVLDMHGEPRSASWLQLAASAQAGSSSIRLESPVDWQVRDRIVIASTDFDLEQAEERTVLSVSPDRTRLTLDRPLDFLHWGRVETLGVDERAEVALVNRNVKISGANGAGGHLRFMSAGGNSRVRMSWVEIEGLGVPGEMGSYPVHFHHFGNGLGSYVDSLSVHHSLNRAITLHATRDVLVRNCLAYETLGHAYFLEDGTERNNRLEGNLGLSTRAPAQAQQILSSDATPSTFWVPSTGNVLEGNVAAGSEGHGFWYKIGQTGHLLDAPTFRKNVAHSNGLHGFYKHDYWAVGSPLPTREFVGFTAYKNRGVGLYYRTADMTAVWRDAHLADNATAVFFGSTGTQIDGQNRTALVDSYVVGNSDNIGTPVSPGEIELGRSLPSPSHPKMELLGHELYEGHIESRGTTYANFMRAPVAGSFREAAAFGHVRGANRWAFDPRLRVSGLRLIQAQPLFLTPTPFMESGKASFVLHDVDGSLTGMPGHIVAAATDLITPANGANYHPAWNAQLLPPSTRLANLRFTDRGNSGVESVTFVSETRDAELIVGSANESYFPTSVLVPDDYTLGIRSSSAPRDFRLELLFGYPGDSTIVTLRYAAPGPQTVRVDGMTGTSLGSRAALAASQGSGFAYDPLREVLHVKLELGGTGGTMMDGLGTRVDVMP
ncbi:G8 domain-containing protein [Saltatorellus ferox]